MRREHSSVKQSVDAYSSYVVNVLSAAGTLKGILVLAYSSAKKFGANKYVAVVVAGVSMYPVLNTVLESGQTVHFLGIPLLR